MIRYVSRLADGTGSQCAARPALTAIFWWSTTCLSAMLATAGSAAAQGAGQRAHPPAAAGKAPPATAASKKSPWRPLFDGKSLAGWKVANFGGEGPVEVDQGTITMDMGSAATGITYQHKFPTNNYEVRLQAARLDGIDFFCALTFPVGREYCTFLVGGWAGAVVGISCIDGRDASENMTTRYEKFETGKYYDIRVRVTSERIRAWIDDKQMVNVPRQGHRFSVRPEVDLSKPLGIACWETSAGLRDIRWRPLGKGEK